MRSLAFATLFALAACSAVENTFTIDDDKGTVTGANLVLCGSTTPLRRVDGRFILRKSVNCEGSGYIRLTYATGDKRDCPVGYVTPGAAQDFRFRAGEAACKQSIS
jgi:hypothetical protein